MRRVFKALLAGVIIGGAAGWVMTRPPPLPETVAVSHTPDPVNGALVFAAGGCASCHVAEGIEDKTLLGGGHAITSDFGTFYAPNISPSAAGIGAFTLPEFARAMRQGVAPDGRQYYPAFPYTSYTHMTDVDVADLFAYLRGLPQVDTPSPAHEVSFPFTLTRGISLWNRLHLSDAYVMEDAPGDVLARGRYLVEALGHCAECHTARNAMGGLDRSAWLAGAPNPSGQGRIPDITPDTLQWSEADLVEYFTSGFTPEYDSVGGTMAAVVSNLGLLPVSDRAAIAAYLTALP